MPDRPIPRREPEVVRAEADRRYFGDSEKVPTTSLREIVVRGVTVSSRYDKANELELLRAVVNELPERLVVLLEHIWCDSKANACYSATLRKCTKADADMLGQSLDHYLCEMSSGHNGISLSGAAGGSFYIDCHWPADDAYFGSQGTFEG